MFNNSQSYLAAGGFTGTYAFATQQGTFQVNNFDNRSFTIGPGPAPLTGSNYSAAFANSQAGLKGQLNGTFYGSGANAAANTGGSFAFQSTVPGVNYLASGTFAGKR